MTAEHAVGEACARAALAGNPSDGYRGAVLALTLPQRRATVRAQPASALTIVPESELVRATVTRFAREHAPAAERTELRWQTTIPRCVGMGGSSAIVIATLRALCGLHPAPLARSELAELALAVEVEDLGIAAGLQDRVAQVYGGVTFMDFSIRPHCYESVDAGGLPPLLVAWRSETAQASGTVHASLRARFDRDEPAVLQTLAILATLARDARRALRDHDADHFRRCVDQSFDARAALLELDPGHVEMIDRARAAGASANYAGSGGAIVAACVDDAHRSRVSRELTAIGCGTLHVTGAGL
jgi:glucuronokinase